MATQMLVFRPLEVFLTLTHDGVPHIWRINSEGIPEEVKSG